MTLTPAQLAMLHLIGAPPGGLARQWKLAPGVRRARVHLIQIAGCDFAYDAEAWHRHLIETNAGGYRFGNGHLRIEPMIAAALASEEWQAVVARLQSESRRSVPDGAPPPELALGDWVEVVLSERCRTPRTGYVHHIEWHRERRAYCYYITCEGREISKRYFLSDLQRRSALPT